MRTMQRFLPGVLLFLGTVCFAEPCLAFPQGVFSPPPVREKTVRGDSDDVIVSGDRLGTDLRAEAMGMNWRNPCPPEIVRVDGRMCEQEKRMDLGLPEEDREASWQGVAGPQGSMRRRGRVHDVRRAVTRGITS
jgi:hypothetical protein